MATMRERIVAHIDMCIEMLQESINSNASDIDSAYTDEDIESIAYDIKRVRTLKSLRNVLKLGGQPTSGSKEDYALKDIIEEMIDLDV